MPLSVAFAIGTHSEVHLDSKGVTSLDSPSTIAEMTSLADTLDALDASSVRATVRIEPAVLNGLQQLDSALFAGWSRALQRHQVVAETQWPLDASEAAAANQDGAVHIVAPRRPGPALRSWSRAVGDDAVDDLRRHSDQPGRCHAAARPRRRIDGDDTEALRLARRHDLLLQRQHGSNSSKRSCPTARSTWR